MTEFIITCDSELKPDGSYNVKRFRELVRCKNCKHYTEMPGKWMCDLYDWVHEGDWYCADGERSAQ